MSWKVVVGLSLLGLAMGLATVFAIAPSVEPFYWVGVYVVSAVVIAKRAPGRYFLHGLAVSVLDGVWVAAAHLALFDTYAAGHAREVAFASHWGSPQVVLAAFGAAAGLVSGIVLGVFAWFASKFLVSAHSEYAGW